LAGEAFKMEPLEQFKLHPVAGLGAVNFTQANLVMVIGGLLVLALLIYGTRPRATVPGRLQALAEMLYEFVRNMAIDQIGPEGVVFFPFVFTLFMFVLMGNLLGLIPFMFTYTSHIAITGALALFVILLATFVGLRQHGLHFFSYFAPQGAPMALMPLIIMIEVVSYLSRPVSLSMRLFANMMAGHMILAVFASFAVVLGSLGFVGLVGAIVPFGINIPLIGFELLVAVLQAYVFAILTCIYLHDAVHLH
jgi:F-type H+-transporting ATPase subunit a